MSPLKILAVVGSLRGNSANHTLVQHLQRHAPATTDFTIFDGLGTLPHFDGSDHSNPALQAWRDALRAADAVLICTPEYAFGVPGTLKNALDWTVGSGEWVDKPVALITAATGGENAHASLLLTLGALSAKVVEGATLVIPFIRAKIKNGDVADAETQAALKDVFTALTHSVLHQSSAAS